LINGSGSSKPLGIIPALEALGSTATPFIIASGSANNTGGAETGANSIGSADIASLYHSVDSAYRNNPKTAFWMADSTLQYLDGLVTKYGQPLHLVKWVDGEPQIFGKPVKVSPSIPAIGPSQVSVLFGDFGYWFTKIVTGVAANGSPLSYVQSYTEGPALIENGLIGFRAFLRVGGALAVSDAASKSPINWCRNHS
jgi:HK97 family phage major capsid protein